MFPVRELHLEDILLATSYSTPAMEKLRRQCPHSSSASHASHQSRSDVLADITRGLTLGGGARGGGSEGALTPEQDDPDVVLEEGFDDVVHMDGAARERMDKALSQAFVAGKQEHFNALLQLIFEENYPIDYKVRKRVT